MGGRTARSRAKCSSNCNDLGKKKTVVFSRKNGDVHYIIMTFHHQNISKHISKLGFDINIWDLNDLAIKTYQKRVGIQLDSTSRNLHNARRAP